MKTIGITLLSLILAGSFSPLFAVDEQRQAYKKMVEESTQEADEYLQEKQKKKQETEAKSKTKQDTGLADRVQAERKSIEAEMDTVRNRGLGPNFTQGMKDNQLQLLQDKLNHLMSDPEAYFK